MIETVKNYEIKKHQLIEQMKRIGARGVGIQKDTSNLFRNRTGAAKPRIDVRN